MALKIQFREPDETIEAYLRMSGLNPNDVAREAFEERVRGMIAMHRQARLSSRKINLPDDAGARWTRAERDG